MKFRARVLTAAVMFIACAIIQGCSALDLTIKRSMTEYLDEKYSDEFEIVSLSKGRDDKYKAVARRKGATRLVFDVNYDKVTNRYTDNYAAGKFVIQVSDIVGNEIKKYWNKGTYRNLEVRVGIDDVDISESSDYLTLRDEYKGQMSMEVRMDVYLANVGEAVEADKVERFVDDYCKDYFTDITITIDYYDSESKNAMGALDYTSSVDKVSREGIMDGFRY